jgi:hypothetical protein
LSSDTSMEELEEPVRDIAATPSPPVQGVVTRRHNQAPRVGMPQSASSIPPLP